MNKLRLILALFMGVFCYNNSANSQTDICAAATVITPNNAVCSYQPGTSLGASQSLTTCSGGGNADDDVWYQFVANSTEMHIKVNPSDLYDPVVQLFSGTCGTLASVVCKDGAAKGVTEEIIATGLINGNTYYVRVYNYGVGSGSNDFSICIFGVPAPVNNTPCTATTLPLITPSCSMGTYTTIGATASGVAAPGTCGTVGYSGGDIWFTATVPANGAVEVSFQAGVMLDGVMALYTGACSSLSLVACDDDLGPGTMPYLYQSGLTPGATVFIRVWEFNNDNPGTFDMCVSSPLNDNCLNSSLICDFNGYGGITSAQYTPDRPGNMFGNGETAAGVYLGSTNTVHSGGPFGPANGSGSPYPVSIENNSWITFVANGPKAVLDVEVEYCLSGNGLQMQIFSGTNCTGFTAVSNFIETTSSQTLTATGLITGQTYYIMIDGFGGDICNYTITAQSGVQVVDITSSAGTSVCPGQATQLTVEASGATSYSWSAAPGGAFGTGSQTETVTVTTPTVYTVTVTGFCDASETTNITITPDKVVVADFYATALPTSLSAPAISPFPTSLNCDGASIALWALDSAAAGSYITPALNFVFISDNFAVLDGTNVTIYEDGVSIYSRNPLADNTILTVTGEYLSPTSVYTFDICDGFGDGGVDWEVYDGNTGLLIGSGTLVSGSPCETFGPFSPAGTSSWSITPATAALTQADFGLALFSPSLAGVGSYAITYSWDNSVGCSDTKTRTINVVNPHNASWTPPAPICSNSGLLTLTSLIDASASSTAGTWSGTGVSGTSFNPSGLSGNIAITYTVGGVPPCNSVVSHNITVNSAPTANGVTHNLCEDVTGGGIASGINLTILEAPMDGGAGYTFSWFNNIGLTIPVGTPTNVSSANNGVFYASITDGICATTANATIAVSSIPNITVSSSPITCNGGGDGTVSVVASGGSTTNYTYAWNPPTGNTSSSIASLGLNTYNVSVTSGICVATGSAAVTQPSAVTASITSSTSVTCNGAASGSASAAGLGGNGAPYSYTWSNGQNSSTATGLSAGVTYTVTATDNSGVCNATSNIILAEPATVVTASIISTTSVTCNGGNNGTATASGVGGNGAPFTYLWSNGQNTAIVTGLSAGIIYSVTVSDKSGICNAITTITIAEPTAISVSFSGAINASCASGTDGQVTTAGAGGTGGYSYQWGASANSQITPIATGLIPGTYTVTVTDASFCTATGVATILNLNNLPTATIAAPSELNCTILNTTLDATASTGTGTLTYLWNTISGNIVSGGTTNIPVINLPGTYTITVTDGANGCTNTNSVAVSQNITIPTTTITACINTSSVGGTDGGVSVSAGTAVGPYTYNWSPAPATGQTTNSVTGLSANSYTTTITAANGCSATDGCTVNDPGCLVTVAVSSTTNVSCNGGTDGLATVAMTGGGTSFTYNWANGQLNATATGLSQGSYGVTVTDNSGCIGSTIATINQPTILSASSSINQQVTCNGNNDGSATINALGGLTNYTYNWSGGLSGVTESALAAGTYTITITDANLCATTTSLTITELPTIALSVNCTNTSIAGGTNGSSSTSVTGGDSNYTYNWSNGATGANATGLSSGFISITVSDGNGCSVVGFCNVLDAACAIVLSTTATNATCNNVSNGQIVASASGGIVPYVYTWSDGQITTTATGLPIGNINVTVTDVAKCVSSTTISISEPSAIIPTIVCTATSIAGGSDGSSTTSPTGGASGYTYLWSNGQTGATATGLAAGNISVTVTDGSLCTTTANCNVLDANCSITLPTTVTDATCNGGTNGQVAVATSGGITPYTYTWSDGQTGATASGLSTGNISVTVTDAATCFDNATVSVSEPSIIIPTIACTATSIAGGSDGSSTTSPIGGASGYTYLWANGQTSATATGLAAGNITVTVTDGNGCSFSDICNVLDASCSITLPTTVTDATCNGGTNGQVAVSTSGGITPYTYTWSDGQTGATATGLPAGNISVTVTDAATCFDNATVSVSEPSLIITNISCTATSIAGGSDGNSTATSTGGASSYTYLWANGQTGATATGLAAGNIIVSVTDGSFCTTTANCNVADAGCAIALNTTATATLCNGNNSGQVVAIASGGITPYTYTWSDGQTGATATGLATGNINVTVTDAATCFNNATISVSEPSLVTPNIVCSGTSIAGGSDGNSVSSPIGGVGGYTYIWSNGQTAATATGLTAGNINVTVTDSNLCTTIATCNVIDANCSITLPTTVTDVVCNSGTSGQVAVSTSGGITPYTYTWSDGQTGAIATGLSTGNISVTVTDAATCFDNATFSVSEPSAIIPNIVCTATSIAGGSDGSSTTTPTGGASGYTYLWSDGQTNITATGLSAGNITVTVTDGSSCSFSDICNVLDANCSITLPTTVTDVSCNGGTDGQVAVATSGGITPYSYTWSNGQTGAIATGLSTGNISVTVTDAATCFDNATVSVSESSVIIPNIVCSNTSVAGGSDGNSVSSPTGGTGSYTYLWANGQTTATATGVPAGIITVTVTDGSFCAITANCNVLDASCAITISTTVTNATCNGGSSGLVTASTSGGISPYVYTWFNGQTGATATGLPTGSISVTVTDAATCFDITTATVSEPSLIAPNIVCSGTSIAGGSDGNSTSTPTGGASNYTYLWSNGQTSATATGLATGNITVTVTDGSFCAVATTCNVIDANCSITLPVTVTDVTCDGGSNGQVAVTTGGGIPPYVYLWSNGQTGTTATGLLSGSISVTVTDAATCFDNSTVTVSQPSSLTITTANVTSVTCNGLSNGGATISLSGATTPYSYIWETGSTSSTLSGVPAGTYTYTVTDGNGCVKSGGVNSTTISNCVKIRRILVDACVSGTTNEWEEEMLFFQTGTSILNTVNLTVTWANLTNTWGGICTNPTWVANTNATITSGGILLEPIGGVIPPHSKVLLVTSSTPITSSMDFSNLGETIYVVFQCPGNTQGHFTNFGTSGGITKTITIDFGSGCSNTVTYDKNLLVDITGIPSSADGAMVNYDGSISYTNTGCVAPFDTLEPLTVTINEPQPLSITATPTAVNCFGYSNGSASSISSGGVSPYTYLWTNGQTTVNTSGLSIGENCITTTDQNGCVNNQCITITEPNQISVTTASAFDALCVVGNASASINNITGGLGTSYTYLWDNGQTNSLATNLSDGQHCVTIADALNTTCTTPYCVTVSVIQGPSVTATNATLLCNGSSDGISNTTVTDNGGSTVFIYQWSNGQTATVGTNLSAGNYTLTVTDGNNCTVTDAILVIEPTPLQTTATGNSVCFGSNTGTINVTVTGGISPYYYLWNNGSTLATQTGLSSGNFSITISDSNTCEIVKNTTITSIPLPAANNVSDAVCESIFGSSTATSIDLTNYETSINGGLVSYTWLESNQTTLVVDPTNTSITNVTNFYVEVSDGICLDTSIVSITILQGASVNVTGGGEACTDSSNTVNVVFSFGGQVPYSFSYLYNTDTITITNYTATNYTITGNVGSAGNYVVTNLTGANGCSINTVSDSVAIVAVGPTADFTPDIDQGDPPLEVVFNNFSTNTGFEEYVWQFGDGSTSVDYEVQHIYTVGGDYEVILSVKDFRGCTDTAVYQYVIVSDASSFLIPVVFSPNSDGINDEFRVKGYNLKSVTGEIFNRWGEKVYELHQTNQGWDGRTFAGGIAPAGVYFVTLHITGIDGTIYEPYSGTLTLVR